MKIAIEGSGRHVHLNEEAVKVLFGEGYELTEKRSLSNGGGCLYQESVQLIGPKGSFPKVGVLGPLRKDVQVEISFSDARVLGVNPPIRLSGDLKGSASCTLIGPAGTLEVKEGLIVAQRHIHLSGADAEAAGIADKEVVMVKVGGERGIIMDEVPIRLAKNAPGSVMHVDYDELNAGAMFDKPMYGEIIKK